MPVVNQNTQESSSDELDDDKEEVKDLNEKRLMQRINEAELQRKLALKTLYKLLGDSFIYDVTYRDKILSDHFSSQ